MSNTVYHREVRTCPAIAEPIAVSAAHLVTADQLIAWLATSAETYQLCWFLAHLDDGVLWGRWQPDQGLITSHQASRGDPLAAPWCPVLRPATLQQARLFASHAELMLWRDEDHCWRARILRDSAADEVVREHAEAWTDAFDEPQLLWGTEARLLADGFSLVTQGQQGMRHVLPYAVKPGKFNTQTLTVRHYLTRGGLAQVDASRLVNLPAAEAKV